MCLVSRYQIDQFYPFSVSLIIFYAGGRYKLLNQWKMSFHVVIPHEFQSRGKNNKIGGFWCIYRYLIPDVLSKSQNLASTYQHTNELAIICDQCWLRIGSDVSYKHIPQTSTIVIRSDFVVYIRVHKRSVQHLCIINYRITGPKNNVVSQLWYYSPIFISFYTIKIPRVREIVTRRIRRS